MRERERGGGDRGREREREGGGWGRHRQTDRQTDRLNQTGRQNGMGALRVCARARVCV